MALGSRAIKSGAQQGIQGDWGSDGTEETGRGRCQEVRNAGLWGKDQSAGWLHQNGRNIAALIIAANTQSSAPKRAGWEERGGKSGGAGLGKPDAVRLQAEVARRIVRGPEAGGFRARSEIVGQRVPALHKLGRP